MPEPTMPTRRERKKERVRLAFIESCRRNLWAHGYEGTTMDMIAGSSDEDMSTRTLFRYFATKDDLVFTSIGLDPANLQPEGTLAKAGDGKVALWWVEAPDLGLLDVVVRESPAVLGRMVGYVADNDVANLVRAARAVEAAAIAAAPRSAPLGRAARAVEAAAIAAAPRSAPHTK